MNGYQLADFENVELSVAMTETIDAKLVAHLNKGECQEDLTFAFWRPSRGSHRYTAILNEILLPNDEERLLQGNVAFTADYLRRALHDVPDGFGIALLHSHLGPGWQGMSRDDEVAEGDRMGGAVAARTGLPVLGLTWGTDGAWSARFWFRKSPNKYERRWVSTVRVVGRQLKTTFHPVLHSAPASLPSQKATLSVWGSTAQNQLVRCHVGIIGLGSVGSILSESLGRTGLQRITLIDHDKIEERNLDRTLGSRQDDVSAQRTKVDIAARTLEFGHTAGDFKVTKLFASLLTTTTGLELALDCDVLMSCVDRPMPRHLLNVIAKAHLIPIIDGGILARVDPDGLPQHVDWRIHTVGPSRRCLYCLGALRRSDVSLDRDGLLDDPDYIDNLPSMDREQLASRRNIFAFSLSVASHQTLQLVGLVSGLSRIGGIGPQHYAAYPGRMTVEPIQDCDEDCDINSLTATACDLTSNVNLNDLKLRDQNLNLKFLYLDGFQRLISKFRSWVRSVRR